LALFSALESLLPSPELTISLVFSLADILSAHFLSTITSDKDERWKIAAKYHLYHLLIDLRFLFNPLTLATCLGRSSSSFSNLAILASISHAQQGNSLSELELIRRPRRFSHGRVGDGLLLKSLPCLIATFVATFMSNASGKSILLETSWLTKISTIKLLGVFTVALAVLLLLSYSLVGSWDFLSSTYGVMYIPSSHALIQRLLLPDLTPNVGLWWYFFIEMFDSFRSFFLVVFQLHLVIYVAPLCIRLPRKPLAIITTLIGIISIFKSYPSVSDLALYLALLSLHTNIFSRKPVKAEI
jgi:GPI-anchor transamidase subunit U